MRQIPYIANWLTQDVQELLLNCKERRITNRGQLICEEGEPCKKVIILVKGEAEIVKTNLKEVYFNESSGMVAIHEKNDKAELLKSEYIPLEMGKNHSEMSNKVNRNMTRDIGDREIRTKKGRPKRDGPFSSSKSERFSAGS